MNDKPPIRESWAEAARLRGLTGAAHTLLTVLEPVGPLGAQILWVLQPVLGVFGWQRAAGEIARALEEPGGVDALRRRLDDESQQ